MNTITAAPKNIPTFSIESVQTLVAQKTIDISKLMVEAIITGHQEKLNFKQLAEKHINVNLNIDLSSCDSKMTLVYRKLFNATREHAKRHSPVLCITFDIMNQQTNNDKTSDLFIASFALPATRDLIKQLQVEQPGAAECSEIWQ